MNDEEITKLELWLNESEMDDEGLDQLTRQLQSDINDLGIHAELILDEETAEGTKNIDPVILGALAVAIGPTVLTKFLDFLHAWAMRRETCTVKIKIQAEKGDTIEIEVPATMSHDEARNWIETVYKSLPQKKKKQTR